MLRPRLLIVSHVLPFPSSTGQQQRVLQTVKSLSENFHITFATVAEEPGAARRDLMAISDDAVVLRSAYPSWGPAVLMHKLAAGAFAMYTGMKTSNYTIGHVELSPDRLLPHIENRSFDCALFEYWHAESLVPALHAKGIPCVLDMHNVLWQARARELDGLSTIAPWAMQIQINRYKRREEQTWSRFDGIVAISFGELEYVLSRVPSSTTVFYAPMGVDIANWPFRREVREPPRVVYYGGLGNRHNQLGVQRCAQQIMPRVWTSFPEAEFWIVGTNPPAEILKLTRDQRIHVTGFVERPQDLLATMSVALCPWSGRFGFRSRLVELMSAGVPVVATPDAVFGMGLAENHTVLTAESDVELAGHVMTLLSTPESANQLSRRGRRVVERKFTVKATYGEFSRQLFDWVLDRQGRTVESRQ